MIFLVQCTAVLCFKRLTKKKKQQKYSDENKWCSLTLCVIIEIHWNELWNGNDI